MEKEELEYLIKTAEGAIPKNQEVIDHLTYKMVSLGADLKVYMDDMELNKKLLRSLKEDLAEIEKEED
jgi:hypothetical protein